MRSLVNVAAAQSTSPGARFVSGGLNMVLRPRLPVPCRLTQYFPVLGFGKTSGKPGSPA